ncbi:MAG: radical SAM protein [Ruminococcaceae bacterium]|nr:radical SAM protein [Oscillospiraceae bacterium]
MSRHVNIPIFIPHLGCPNQCVFCNQRTISGVTEFDLGRVRTIIDEALATVESDAEVEIAFFGGSFTGIDRELMCSLLKTAYEYVLCGAVKSIRCSTRPDYIDEEILAILKKYGVKTVELGLQSASDKVLSLTKRGHDFSAEKRACKMIVDSGFSLVGQMMIGLPGADAASETLTANFIVSSGASAARIYPTVVFRQTELCDMAEQGEYTPLSISEAISRSANVLEIFDEAGVDVIRIGLAANENLSSEDTYYAGPNHPSLGELIENELYYRKIRKLLTDTDVSGDSAIDILVSRGSLSKAVGQKKINKLRLSEEYPSLKLCFKESADLLGRDVLVKVNRLSDN